LQVRSFLYGVIVPSLLFIIGCSQSDTATSSGDHPILTEAKPQTSFALTDIDGRTTTLTLRNGQLRLSRVVQPRIILHLFSTRADLCRAMLPYLSDLQRKRGKSLFLLGIAVPESLDTVSLRDYMRQNDTTFFVSASPDNRALGKAIASMLKWGSNYPLPLTVIFDHGKYITHYEGVTPIEMIRNDLNALDSTPRRPL
jgi:hypothetical protein